MPKTTIAGFVRPDWLGPKPHNEFKSYGDSLYGNVWYLLDVDHPTHSQSCYATHTAALQGDPVCLEIMKRYYVALATQRVKA